MPEQTKAIILKQIGKNASNSPTTDIYLKTIHIISTEETHFSTLSFKEYYIQHKFTVS